MRIERIHIDGYGVFSGFSLGDLSPKATVIAGPNESGKTTLLSFIRTSLFGFGGRSENAYEPLRGGRHGGRIFLVDGRNESYVVERFAGPRGGTLTLTLPGGAAGTANDLADLLGHASRDLFRNVFAFSLVELQTFDTLRNDDVRTRIYGAGLGAGRLGVPEIEKKIQQDRERLYREGGSAQTIAALLREADDIQAKLHNLSSQVAVHDRLRRKLEAISHDIEAKQEERGRRRVEAVHISNLISAWDDWTEFRSAQTRLDELPAVSQFPADGIARLERALQQRDDLEGQIQELQAEVARAQEEMNGTELDEKILAQAAEIEGLKRGLERYESARDDLPRRQSELEGDLKGLEDGLRGLGPDWDESRVKEFDTSLTAREAVRGYGAQLKAGTAALHDAERDAERAKAEHQEARSAHDSLEKELKELEEPPERDRRALDERRRRLRQLRGLLADSATSQLGLGHLKQRKADLEARINWFERAKAGRAVALPAWPAAVAPLLGAALAALLALLAGWLAAVVIAVAGLGAGLAYQWLRRSLKTGASLDVMETELETLTGQLERIENEAATVDSRITNEASSIGRLAEELGFGDTPDAQALDSADDALEGNVEVLRKWEAARQRLRDAAQRAERLEARVQEANEAANQAQDETQEAKKAWASWLDERGTDPAMSPDTCLELLSRVDGLREKIKAIDGLRTRIDAIAKAIDGFEGRTNLVRQACNREERARGGFPGAVDELIEAVNAAKKNSESIQQLRKEIEAATDKKQTLDNRAEMLDTSTSALLQEGGATDQEDFRRRAEVFAEREQLLSTVRERRRNLERVAGREEALDAFMQELEGTDPEELQQKKRDADEYLERIESELESMGEERGQVIEQIRQLETEEESSELRVRLSVLKEKINDEAQKWSVLAFVKTLLEETRLKYERERQPAVIQEAQSFFRSFTNARYERIFSLPGENQIEVEDHTGQRKAVPDLSRGTAEQLYLALRFGLVREFAKRAEPLPVVMDDILVNFDPTRARQAFRALDELSKEQQVLLFTCHPETVELARSEIEDCKVVDLQLGLA
jgi:uncharacterized protein YhaN